MNTIATFFAWSGRLGRGAWLGRTLLAGLVAVALGRLAASVAGDPGALVTAALFVICAAALAVRRLHDTGRTAWSLLVAVVPVVGPLWLLFQLTRPGVEGRNRYGTDPDARLDYLQVDIAR